MDNAKQHWKILQKLGNGLENKVREFLVVGKDGDGLIVATESGEGYWLEEIKFINNETNTTTKPTRLDVSDLDQMAQGCMHILLLNKRGEIYSMGMNNFEQLQQFRLGINHNKIYYSPQLIPSPHKFISVRCGWWHSVALTEDGKVCAWGLNGCGEVGVPASCISTIFFTSPRQIPELDSHRVVAVECGAQHSLALTDRGEVYGWGWNGSGVLGVGSESFELTPIRIPTPSPVQSMAAGSHHTLLLTQTGEVWACGWNRGGQLGLPTTTESSASLVKVAGLPPISQISSHYATKFSIAMSFDQQCFVWGKLYDETITATPKELSPDYSTVESPLSFFPTHRSTPHSVQLPETPPSPLSSRMSRMFDNPETSPDVQFVVEQRTIHAHRIILSNSSDYFVRMFSERWMAPVDTEDPIVRVTITDHSYQVFHVFLRFLYTDSNEVHPDFIFELFDLASQYLDYDLQHSCISRMRTTLTPTTCCLYYSLTHRHSLLPELATFQQELVQFASTRMSEVVHSAAYHSMDAELCKKLTYSIFSS